MNVTRRQALQDKIASAEYQAKILAIDSFRFCSLQCAEKLEGKAAHCPHSRSYAQQQRDYGWRY